MLKEISTYGALLLTALVVYRASSLDAETTEIKSLYQREADDQFTTSNLVLRSQIGAELVSISETKLLASSSSAKKEVPSIIPSSSSNKIQRNVNELSTIAAAEEIRFSEYLLAEEDLSLSLDRESTINRSLSLHVPRQRIQPKPSLD
jgi:hypothetical protein